MSPYLISQTSTLILFDALTSRLLVAFQKHAFTKTSVQMPGKKPDDECTKHQVDSLEKVTILNNSGTKMTASGDKPGTYLQLESKQKKLNYTGPFKFVSFGDTFPQSRGYTVWCELVKLANGTIIIEMEEENKPSGRFMFKEATGIYAPLCFRQGNQ
ncbi:hypothetical protein BDZ91DRAFT_809595 [Kalaharituber pfeilii]|nr:hypothetical protein BDZ91DRAFT_809595 [Kalaharituber pfeilii]